MAVPPGIAAHRYRAAPPTETKPYEFKDAIGGTLRTTAVMGTVGLFFSAVQNTLTKQNVGAWGIFTRHGGTTATFGEHRIPRELKAGR